MAALQDKTVLVTGASRGIGRQRGPYNFSNSDDIYQS